MLPANQEKLDQFWYIGHSVPKVDALDKVLERAVYAEDISFPDMLHGRVLRAGIPHAMIEAIDISLSRPLVPGGHELQGEKELLIYPKGSRSGGHT